MPYTDGVFPKPAKLHSGTSGGRPNRGAAGSRGSARCTDWGLLGYKRDRLSR